MFNFFIFTFDMYFVFFSGMTTCEDDDCSSSGVEKYYRFDTLTIGKNHFLSIVLVYMLYINVNYNIKEYLYEVQTKCKLIKKEVLVL